ncbi:hypothetical protein OCO_42350 [Mycobacterium intracellulare MOTT-02]|uniref:Uncharacterized protein n=1 Tax=Mycobacterium intracellulare (strain ATCC 13950 / DSM 43223 / JCM 6384 / NCTC 13025 / 3600) TaxID=487521 RepID=H8IQP1_MYCIA|nr:hypothetical protein OCU_42280 [Mycobacterium intracellulare ATCC 13950]AFC50598.1 hypothetical protein OCO_42350 [Mycobacterium intracellulare MOTT-02]ETZ31850.1 hypothetical protein L843_4556 [Mycobacterium intracellulare MIN_061107_1834]OBG08350.1 hypothetical protein A5769_04030 [Mycobacterium intracellulare]
MEQPGQPAVVAQQLLFLGLGELAADQQPPGLCVDDVAGGDHPLIGLGIQSADLPTGLGAFMVIGGAGAEESRDLPSRRSDGIAE